MRSHRRRIASLLTCALVGLPAATACSLALDAGSLSAGAEAAGDDASTRPDATSGDGTTGGGGDGGGADAARGDGAAGVDGSDGAPGTRTYAEEVAADAPLAYWRLDDAAGTTAADTEGVYPGTFFATPTFRQPGALVGDPDTAITQSDVDAGGFYANGPFDFSGNAAYAAEGWANLALIDGQYRLLFCDDSGDANGRQEWGLWFQSDYGMGFERYVNGTKMEAHAAAPTTNAWHHFVGTYDGATLAVYVDGVLVGVAADTRPAAARSVPLFLATFGDGYGPIVGAVDEIAIYAHALTAARVKAHYDAAKRP